ncbi:MAG: hypothetical protein ACLTTP_02300 [Alistipes ihumii]
MSFDKLHKWWNRQSAIVVVYVVVMLLPNVLLAITEPYSFTTVTASLLMPGAVYLLLAVALKRPGLMLCSFPLMVLGAFQIVPCICSAGRSSRWTCSRIFYDERLRGRRAAGQHLALDRIRHRSLRPADRTGCSLAAA